MSVRFFQWSHRLVGVSAMFAVPGLVIADTPSGAGIEVHDCIVRFADEVDVPALESGRVAEVSVKANELVERNHPIARLDDASLLIRRRASHLRLESARRESTDDIELRYAKTAVAEAKAEFDTSRSIHNDVSGAVPLSQLRRLSLAVERGELEVAQAEKRRKQAAVEVDLREADLAELDQQLQNLQIESPLSGVVLEVKRSVGEWIEKGQPLATVVRIDRLHVHALVSSEQIAPHLCRSLPVSVHWEDPATGDERSLRGRVLSVDPQMLPGSRFRLHAEIINETMGDDQSQWQLKPGADVRMKVYASASTARKSPLWLNR